MPRIIFNDEAIKADTGESLLAVARRHGAHVWFLCDGRGLCQTCACKVLSGAGNLNAPTDIEVESISPSRREEGHRLACQVRLTGQGDAKVISLAEQVRRRTAEFLTLDQDAYTPDNFTRLLQDFAGFATDFAGSLVSAAMNFVPRLIESPPSISGVYDYLRDGQSMIEKLLTDPLSTDKKN